MRSERPYRTFGRRQRIFILLVGAFWVIICTAYIGLVAGWSAGISQQIDSRPSVLVGASGAWFLVDGHGIIRGAMSQNRILTLPQLQGIDSRALLRQEFPEVDAARTGSELAKLLAGNGVEQTRDLQLNFSDPQDIVASFRGTTIHFGNTRFREKWDRAMSVLGARSKSLFSYQEIDLRFPNTVIVREH